MKNKKNNQKLLAGFTLVELLIVIAIISILSGIVLVSTGTSVEKSKRASAITTASSALPELVTCADDNGVVKLTPVAGETICWTDANYNVPVAGHAGTKWGLLTQSGYNYAAGAVSTATVVAGTYTFKITKSGQADVICDMALNGCS